MEFWKTDLYNWDIGWSVTQIEHNNWAVMYNGHLVQSEFTSKRDASDRASVWDAEMEQEWGIQPLKEEDKFYAK
jgi:hypothetical protein